VKAIPVPDTAEAFLARTFGEEGRRWLAGVPSLTAQLAAEWELQLGPPLRGGVLAVVREATTADGRRAVLKLASRWDRPADEIACLEAWAGGAAPRLLRADPGRGALLLERIEPGQPARHADARAVAGALRELHRSPPAGMRPLADVARKRLARAVEQRRAKDDHVRWALGTIERLEADPVEPALLHGDCDWRNLLTCTRRGLAAIDPLPCAGDPAYDAGYWSQAAGDRGRRQRTTEIADALGLDVARVRGWCAVVAVHG
jgi:streptomycin 6-kinase